MKPSERDGRPPRPIDVTRLPLARFWSSVVDVPSGCIEWTGRLNDKGYGVIGVYERSECRSRQVLAHRLSWAIVKGVDPGDNLVLHHCDNPKCVREEHLYLGTFRDNVQDCLRRGRHRNGRAGHRMASSGPAAYAGALEASKRRGAA